MLTVHLILFDIPVLGKVLKVGERDIAGGGRVESLSIDKDLGLSSMKKIAEIR